MYWASVPVIFRVKCRLEGNIRLSFVVLGIVKSFMFLEVGEDVLEAPAFVAQLFPIIIVENITPHIHLEADTAGSSQAFTAWHVSDFVFAHPSLC